MKRRHLRITALAILALGAACSRGETGNMTSGSKILVAHRGASAYAPEHTRAAYELAIEQGADYIEPDLQITSDGVLIALHDETLDRTTNVAQVFPDRFRTVLNRYGVEQRRWFTVDFTLDEIRSLDAGSWFSPDFAGAQVPTFHEVIEIALGKAGIFPETKAPDAYSEQGFNMEHMVAVELREHGLDAPGGVDGTPVQLQSFSDESLRILRHEEGLDLPSTFLLGSYGGSIRWFRAGDDGLREIAEFATGIGPSKDVLLAFPGLVERAHGVGLTVVPYTFGGPVESEYEDYVTEARYYLGSLGVDGIFINNPDLFPR